VNTVIASNVGLQNSTVALWVFIGVNGKLVVANENNEMFLPRCHWWEQQKPPGYLPPNTIPTTNSAKSFHPLYPTILHLKYFSDQRGVAVLVTPGGIL